MSVNFGILFSNATGCSFLSMLRRQGLSFLFWLDFKNDIHKLVCMCAKSFQTCLTLAIPWTVALQAPLSIGSSRQDYQRGLPCPPPGDLPNLRLLHWQTGSLPLVPPGKPYTSLQFQCFRALILYFSSFKLSAIKSSKVQVIKGKC